MRNLSKVLVFLFSFLFFFNQKNWLLAEFGNKKSDRVLLSTFLENLELKEGQFQPKILVTGILINEIFPAPKNQREKEEWIEIFNQNNFEIDLSGWQISDVEGLSKTYIFPKESKIPAKGFLVLYQSTTQIILNNKGDGLKLSQPDGEIIDSLNYKNAKENQSYNRIGESWVWSKILTPGSENVIFNKENQKVREKEKIDINTAPKEDLVKIIHIGEKRAEELISQRPFYNLDELIKIKGLDKKMIEDIKKEGLAWVNPRFKKLVEPKGEIPKKALPRGSEFLKERGEISSFLFPFFIAFPLSVLSGITIFFFKRKLKKINFNN